jgi:hypothetical protein
VSLVSGIGAAIAIGYRQFPWKIFAMKRRRGPKITEFRRPRIELDARQFLIDSLAVEAPSRELDTIRIEILDNDGHTVIEKRLDISGSTIYSATPETISLPPGVDMHPEGSYTVRVKAVDTGGKSAERHSTARSRYTSDRTEKRERHLSIGVGAESEGSPTQDTERFFERGGNS